MAQNDEQIPLSDLNGEQVAQNTPTMDVHRSSVIRAVMVRYKVIIIIVVFGILAIGFATYFNTSNVKVCQSEPCNNTAKFIVESINQFANPCENFYDFVCANRKESKVYSLNTQLLKTLVTLMDNISEKNPDYLKKLKGYYKSCVTYDTSVMEVKEKLVELYAWPILNPNISWNEVEFDWMKITHKLFKIGIPSHYFLNVKFVTDERNKSKTIIHLNQPFFSISQTILLQDMDSNAMLKIRMLMTKVIQVLREDNDINQEEIEEILLFERELAKISITPMQSDNIRVLYISIRDLEKKYPKIKWLDYINGILTPYAKIDDSEVICIEAPFIDKFYDLMINRKPSNRILANYVLWRTVRTIEAKYLGPARDFDDTTINEFYNFHAKMECAYILNEDIMRLATSALYVQNNNLNSGIAAVKNMSVTINKAFYQIIKKNSWLNNEMKSKLLKKISKMNILIGYPAELLNDTILNTYYQDLETPSESYFVNALNLKKFKFRKNFEALKKPLNDSDWTKQFSHVVGTEAKYAFFNTIYIAGGLIHPLFFDQDVPNYINYAIMGFVLGHEISHCLSTKARLFDESGNFKDDWWDLKSTEIYSKKTKCFIKKYNDYTYPKFDLRINGTLTLDENIADILGLKIAYDAYIDNVKDKPQEPLLVGLKTYTPKQMFWIAYGSSWCSEGESYNLLSKEISNMHSPERYRIIGVVSSLKEFAKDFNCHPTDDMNPPGKCSMWF